MWSRAIVAAGLLTLAAGPASWGTPGAAAPGLAPAHRLAAPAQVIAYTAPVNPLRVLRGFVGPVSRYGPGHRGVDLQVGPSPGVRSAAPGVVRFAGTVAGRGVVVVIHPDGVTTEYEPVTAAVHAGEAVQAGQVIGTLRGSHGGCAGACLHWGARRGALYFDPLTLLRPLGPLALLPWPRSD